MLLSFACSSGIQIAGGVSSQQPPAAEAANQLADQQVATDCNRLQQIAGTFDLLHQDRKNE